ncbi:Protoporphyrinogen oxidase [Spirosomataceae bacterium TFI 002]|nr:Protoporphyrinogen oxidase [Spirosomataceae bacterium TFI 002]
MGTKKKVAIIGGGLSGLSAAIYLQKQSIGFDIYEASNKLGGRVSTELVEGFKLDKGFQVFLNSYDEALALIDFEKLDLAKAASGAMINNGETWAKFGNPLKKLSDAFPTLLSGIGNLKDKYLVFRLSREVSRLSQEDIQKEENLSTLDFLRKYGFSNGMISNFFKPFFGGVFLDFELKTSSRLFLYLFKKFNEGDATLPSGGMEAIVKAMVKLLPTSSIHLNTKVDLENTGDYLSTIVAVNESALSVKKQPTYNKTSCFYFSCDTVSFQNTSYLHLNPTGGLIRHVCFLNRIQPTYAPKGKDLLSVTVSYDEKLAAKNVEIELSILFENQLEGLKFLKVYHIPEALSFYDGEMKGVHKNTVGQIVCGDHTLYPSINGALKSGRLAAEMAIADLA